MKKIIIGALVALGCVCGVWAKDTQYKVYDVLMSLKTTKAGGVTTTACGDTYVYREKGTRKILGVIAGCGCLAMAGDPTCTNFETYFWDASTKTQLTNFTWKTELLQRIGKTGTTVEQVVTFTIEDQAGEKFEIMLAGFGTYRVSRYGYEYDTISVNGNVTGTLDAPYKTTRGSCGACADTPDTVDQTQAAAVCEDGICTESDTSAVTPVCGTYTMKYNPSKSAKAERYGVTDKTLGLPSYVKISD